MTELIINGVRAVLPDNLKFTLFEENPLITQRGEFSLDIELSLLNSTNAKIFKHLDRLNSIDTFNEATANLIVDNEQKNGKIIDIQSTDKVVKFQFLAGNSEVNYISSDKKIWDLNWGTETAIDYARALKSIGYSGYGKYRPPHEEFYYNNFVCTPVQTVDKNGGNIILNKYTVSQQTTNNPFEINGIENIVMQPYLMYYINKLPELLGYTLNSNILDNDVRAKKIYLTNTVQSLEYHYALPDMTISEFIDEISNLFNIEFKVNSALKTIDIIRVSSSIQNATVSNLENVLSSFDRTNEEKNLVSKLAFNKLSYDVGSTDYYNYQKFNDEIMNKMEIQDFPDFISLYNYLDQNNFDIDIFKIYRDLETHNEWIGLDNINYHPKINFYTYPITEDGNFDYFKMFQNVNKLASYINENGDKELILKIVPAEILKQSITVNYVYNNGSGSFPVYYQAPKSNKSLFLPTTQGLKATVETGEKTSERLSNIEIGMYSGKIKLYYDQDSSDITTTYPFSNIDELPDFSSNFLSKTNCLKSKEWAEGFFTPNITSNLKLKGSNGINSDYYAGELVDFSTLYVFKVLVKKPLNINNLYHYKGLKLIPVSFEKSVTKKGLDKVLISTFYKLK